MKLFCLLFTTVMRFERFIDLIFNITGIGVSRWFKVAALYSWKLQQKIIFNRNVAAQSDCLQKEKSKKQLLTVLIQHPPFTSRDFNFWFLLCLSLKAPENLVSNPTFSNIQY